MIFLKSEWASGLRKEQLSLLEGLHGGYPDECVATLSEKDTHLPTLIQILKCAFKIWLLRAPGNCKQTHLLSGEQG